MIPLGEMHLMSVLIIKLPKEMTQLPWWRTFSRRIDVFIGECYFGLLVYTFSSYYEFEVVYNQQVHLYFVLIDCEVFFFHWHLIGISLAFSRHIHSHDTLRLTNKTVSMPTPITQSLLVKISPLKDGYSKEYLAR